MERSEAKRRLEALVGEDLRELAKKYEVPVFRHGKKNKGWAGHVIERYLGLPLNSAQSPNFGSWELKTVSLKRLKSGPLTVKETMAITMIDPYNVVQTPFHQSHLLSKLRKILILARIWEGVDEESSIVYSVTEFDLDDPETYQIVANDYELVRKTIMEEGFDALKGEMGRYIQPRTKGPGHGSKSRAFYARTIFLKKVVFKGKFS